MQSRMAAANPPLFRAAHPGRVLNDFQLDLGDVRQQFDQLANLLLLPGTDVIDGARLAVGEQAQIG